VIKIVLLMSFIVKHPYDDFARLFARLDEATGVNDL